MVGILCSSGELLEVRKVIFSMGSLVWCDFGVVWCGWVSGMVRIKFIVRLVLGV